ncbi:MAG: hypothetical protein JWO86_8743 [Myxococcaceae bacterium]|jgi:hypothetical protein|nr:hypothetical protein [Myxococcaceae bacterium]MEA2752529.1 hypothetical protein [Myxococcales bacterium]
MSTKSKARAARRNKPEEVILGEIMGAFLSAITFGAIDSDSDSEDENDAE